MGKDHQKILDDLAARQAEPYSAKLRRQSPLAAEMEFDANGNRREYFTSRQWNALTEEQQQYIWRRIYNENYPLYELLRTPGVPLLKKAFGATPAIEKYWLQGYQA